MNNFHNDYAIPLEEKARAILRVSERQRGAIFDADAIELGSFFEIMVLTLRVKSSYQQCTEIDNFIEKYENMLCVNLNNLEEELIQNALSDYLKLLKAIENSELKSE